MVLRDSPNSRAACRMLMPSTCTARLMRAYTSTLYTSRCPTKHNYLVLFWTKSVVVYFGTATKRRSRGVLWSIIAPPFIHGLLRGLGPGVGAFSRVEIGNSEALPLCVVKLVKSRNFCCSLRAYVSISLFHTLALRYNESSDRGSV